VFRKQDNRFAFVSAFAIDGSGNSVGGLVQRFVGQRLVCCFECDPVRILKHDFLKPLGDRLIDFIPRELFESTAGVKTLRPYSLLLQGKVCDRFGEVTHFVFFHPLFCFDRITAVSLLRPITILILLNNFLAPFPLASSLGTP